MFQYCVFQTFYANSDARATHYNALNPPLVGTAVRLNPFTWYGAIEFRMELYGCPYNGPARKYTYTVLRDGRN